MGLSFFQVVEAALRSMGTALTMAGFGGLLARGNGPLKPKMLKNLARVSMLVTIPSLLFTNILNCTQDWSTKPCTNVKDTIISAWPMLFLPAINVSVGAFLGYIIVCIIRPPKNFRRAVVAACAFGNSTGLPITLLTVIHAAFPPSTDLGAINPVLFLSVYLLLYPMLQWGVGGAILGEEKDSIDDLKEPFMDSTSKAEVKTPLNDSGRSMKSVVSHTESDDGTSNKCIPERVWLILPMIFKPAVISVSVAILFAVTPIQTIFVDTKDRDDDAPLEWFFDGVYNVGRAAVPLNMFLLGAKLSKGAQWGEVRWLTSLLIAFVKLIIMPSVGLGTVYLLSMFVHLDKDIAPSFYLVTMIVTCTPTANSIMVMAELSGQNKKALATCIFTQYMFAPFTLSAAVILFVSIAQSFAEK